MSFLCWGVPFFNDLLTTWALCVLLMRPALRVLTACRASSFCPCALCICSWKKVNSERKKCVTSVMSVSFSNQWKAEARILLRCLQCLCCQDNKEDFWRWRRDLWLLSYPVLYDSQILNITQRHKNHIALLFFLSTKKGSEVRLAFFVKLKHVPCDRWLQAPQRKPNLSFNLIGEWKRRD